MGIYGFSSKTKVGRFEVHIATQGNKDPLLETRLKEQGYSDDRLACNYVAFSEYGKIVNYPIGIHMSKKGLEKEDVRNEMEKLERTLKTANAVGYTHSEVVAQDVNLVHDGEFKPLPLPIEKLDIKPRKEHKRWDIHISIPYDLVPVPLREQLMGAGFDHIDKYKGDIGEVSRIYSVQGVSAPSTGHRLFETLATWLRSMRIARGDMKFEVTTDMRVYGDVMIIPPTIEEIRYLQQ